MVEAMIPTRIARLALSAALALILPLESAHCAFMRFERHAAPITEANASHECCPSAGSATAAHTSKSKHADDSCGSGCACFQLPAGIPASAIALIETPISA